MITTEAPEETTRASGKNRWFQLGLLSAGAAAPLIARWRNLRAAEQAEALRDQASARWNDALARVATSIPQDAIQEALRQVGPQTQESLRQVSAVARDALQRLPGVNRPAEIVPVEIVPAPAPRRRPNATLWLVGVGVGVVAAGAAAYIILRNRMSVASDDDTLVEIPLTAAASNGGPAAATQAAPQSAAEQVATASSEGPAIIEESPDEEPGVAEPFQFSESDAEGAAYIGNILSRVYHPADSKRLPAPQNRIYFATEEDAIAAGYRPDGAESATRASDTTHKGE